MPYESKAQKGAMYAAAAGKSTLGIPKKVAKSLLNLALRQTNYQTK